MDDYLSEKEQLAAIREWWREYGWYLAGGVVLGVAILFGMRQLQSYQDNDAELAASIYQELRLSFADDADAEVLTLLEELREEFPDSPYTDQAGMLAVIMHMQNQSTRQAIDTLRYTLDNTSDEHLAMIVRLRLVRLLVSADRFDEAITLLDSVDPGSFAARFSEIRGDIYYAENDTENSRRAYQEALNSQQSDLVDRNLIQMKLDDLAESITLTSDEEVLTEDTGR